MQNKQLQPNSSPRNMTGIYLGMVSSPPRFNHISAIPPLFRRRSLYRAKTSVEYQRYKRIEMLRVIEPRQGFKGAVVKPKLKSVSPKVELQPHYHNKSPLLTAEELRKLTRKVLRDFGIPRQNNGDKSGRRNKSSGLLNSPRKSPNSSRQSNIQELSVVVNAGKSNKCDDPYRVTLAKQELTRTKPYHQEVCESAAPFQPERSSHTKQPRSSGAQHSPLKYLQSSQAFTMTEQISRAAKTYSQSTTEEKTLLPSAYVSGSPVPLPRKSKPLGRAHLAWRCGYTESSFPEYKMTRLNATLGGDLISKTLELKQRKDGNDNSKQVPVAAPVNDTHVTNGSGRIDASKSKATPSIKVRSPFNSGARTSPHTERNDQCTGSEEHRQTDACEHKVQERFEEEHPKDLLVELSDLTKVEDSQMYNLNDEEEDEETLEIDSTVQLAKQIEVIINLKTKVDSTDCSSEKG
ncbi:uncharacterized protein [Heterodontus francisci]|uniref:uncharacterized protein isoform X2 n=1 Tax=Heterodontus francisci TaxID=7792 RepID=UPI00355B8844